MPPNPHLKAIISTAVTGAERLIYTYPQHFHDIEQAKAHIGRICAAKDFAYAGKMRLSAQDEEYVEDRTQFLVAVRAHAQGEFGLGVELPDRARLRAAVEHDIARLMPLIAVWPSAFTTVGNAKDFIGDVCLTSRFVFTRFEGVEAEAFRGYVVYNTARKGFEMGLFEMRVPGENWVRGRKEKMENAFVQRPVVSRRAQDWKTYASLHETIEADISRLTPQLPTWPACFADVNAARNWVMHIAYKQEFRYSGWPDVELHRYRMFVNFNTAKYASRRGEFKIGKREEKAESEVTRVVKEMGKIEVSSALAEKAEQKAAEYIVEASAMCDPTTTSAPAVFDAVSSIQDDAVTADHDAVTSANGATTATNNDLSLFTTAELADDTFELIARKTVETGTLVPVEKVDPFKALLADLQRGYILKAAFE